jgi:hypothetical protein
MAFPTATTRAIVATVSALAILASGCATDTTPDLDKAEPASSVPDVAGDPDPDTGEDPDGGVVVDDPAEHGTAYDGDASGDDVTVAPTESRPTAKPPSTAPVPAAKPVQILSGEAARKAAEEAGELDEGGTLPNDVYVKGLGKRVTVAVAGDGGFQFYDCSAGCELVGTTLEALIDGSTKPYGGANAHVTFRVDHGEVVSLVEVYLP